jgi:hypothetical protein
MTGVRQGLAAAVAVLAGLLVARFVVSATVAPSGWTARYFANDSWSGAPEWSADFRLTDATRIDRRVSFKDDEFPAHYLNDARFDRGIRREVSEPMSVDWRGFGSVAAERDVHVGLKARGTATLQVDDRIVLTATSALAIGASDTSLRLSPGAHAFVVRYHKLADTDGLIDLDLPMEITTAPAGTSGSSWHTSAVRLINRALVLVLVLGAIDMLRRSWRPSMVVPVVLFAGFGAQGWWRARYFASHVVSLTSGDDWFGFESCAREILHYGPLMTFGKSLGQGAPYFYHPLYCYFLAVVHGIAGESLFGPILVQFLILAAVGVLMWRLAADLFGERAAVVGVCALVVVFELDFVRYYTVTLLSENLYILTVTLALAPFVRWIRRGDRSQLWQAALWGGISSITRPAMMAMFIPALALFGFMAAERARSWRAGAVAAAIAAAIWLAAIAPVTLRNLVVSGRPVLISEGLGGTFIKYNVPASADPAVYAVRYTGSVWSGLGVLARIAWDHPVDLLRTQGRKLGFSLGMVHWYGGYRPHPELVAVTLLYVATLIASSTMRTRALWPVHLFVLAHLAGMGLTMPWNYGYRLIIPPFVYTTTLATAAAYSLVAA